ncbi:MAG: TIGR03084 family metal-binding protein [Hyphomicrobiaceae bacterium]
MKQVEDFRTEVAELGTLLETLTDAQWETVTQFKGYTINDLVRHLHQGDHMGLASIAGPEAFAALRAKRLKRREGGLSSRDDARAEYGHLGGAALLEAWRGAAARLADALSKLGPDARLRWSGPDMGVKMFATARQMEVWAHGHDVYDILGVERVAQDRLDNIAVIGVRTFGWTFANRGLKPPGPAPRVTLTAPSGAIWRWNEESTSGEVSGSALDFCQVVTQVRNVADTGLKVEGEGAKAWMAIAQCFAGPPEDPPVAGTRHGVKV